MPNYEGVHDSSVQVVGEPSSADAGRGAGRDREGATGVRGREGAGGGGAGVARSGPEPVFIQEGVLGQ